MNVGERIKKLRKEKKLTLAAVAQNQMTPAMLSLIENGKSKPSAENLQHIAKVLEVDVAELMGEVSREKLREVIRELTHLTKTKNIQKSLEAAIKKVQGLIPNLGTNYESAKIYELYSITLFRYYQFYKKEYELLADGDWEKYAKLAEKLYSELQIESKVLDIRSILANGEFLHGNYKKTIEIVDEVLEGSNIVEFDNLGRMMNLRLLKMLTIIAMGEWEEAIPILNESIELMNSQGLYQFLYEIYKSGADLYYNIGNIEKAQEYLKKIDIFSQIVENDELYFDKELLKIHYLEFYENKPEESLRLLDRLEAKVQSLNIENEKIIGTYFKDYLSDIKARCYTKMNMSEKALPLFRNLLSDDLTHIEYHPGDIGIRIISKSYQALAYLDLENIEKAQTLAEETVKVLRKHPHTAYYQFAREVLRKVNLKKA